MHVYFFLEVSIEENILHIHLIKRPMVNSSHNNETSDRCKASNRSKSFLIVNAIFLSKAFHNEVSLVLFNKSISLGLVNLPTTCYKLTRRQINHIPNVIFVKVIKFFEDSLLPKRVSIGLTIGVRLIEDGKSKIAVIISEIRWRNAYLSRATMVRTNKRLRGRWCHKIQDRQVMCQGQIRR